MHVYIICSIDVCSTLKTLRLSIFFMCQIKIYFVVSFTRKQQLAVHCFVKNLYLKSSLRDGLYGIFKYNVLFSLAAFPICSFLYSFVSRKNFLKRSLMHLTHYSWGWLSANTWTKSTFVAKCYILSNND